MRITPQAPPPRAVMNLGRPSALQFLVQAPKEVADACLDALDPADGIALGRSVQQACGQLPAPQQQLLQPLQKNLSEAHRRALRGAMAAGPLKACVVSALGEDAAYGRTPWRLTLTSALVDRNAQAPARAALTEQALAWGVAPELAQGISVCIVALDALAAAAPHTRAWLCLENGDPNGASSAACRRRAGRQALHAALGLSTHMQHSLLAQVTVGCALAFADQATAAEALFHTIAKRDLAHELQAGSGAQGLHLHQLMRAPSQFVDRCLMWIKLAALAADSFAIYEVYLQAKALVPEVSDRYPDEPELNQRWPVLVQDTHLGSPADIAWLQAMGHINLALSLTLQLNEAAPPISRADGQG